MSPALLAVLSVGRESYGRVVSPSINRPNFFRFLKSRRNPSFARIRSSAQSSIQPNLASSKLPAIHSHWRRRGSNPRPPACKAGALPIELRPRGKRSPKCETSGLAARFRTSGVRLQPSPERRLHQNPTVSRCRQPLSITLPVVGVRGLEPRTSALSELRSNQLSYTPSDAEHCAPTPADCPASGSGPAHSQRILSAERLHSEVASRKAAKSLRFS